MTVVFWGQPPIVGLAGVAEGIRLVAAAGIERIRAKAVALTEMAVTLADAWLAPHAITLGSPRDPQRRGGTVTVSTPDHAAVHKELGERGVICDFRPDPQGGIRLGPHFFNTEDEVRRAVSELADIVAGGAYERHLGAATQF